MSNWMPIETAPRDGTRIRGKCKRGKFNFFWHKIWGWVTEDDNGWTAGFIKPTHWQSLPEQPVGLPKCWEWMKEKTMGIWLPPPPDSDTISE